MKAIKPHARHAHNHDSDEPSPRRVRTPKPRKEVPIMVRLDPAQRLLVEGAARNEDLATSTWIRQVILRLARGWRLVPPAVALIASLQCVKVHERQFPTHTRWLPMARYTLGQTIHVR